jgi:hypothetical protein
LWCGVGAHGGGEAESWRHGPRQARLDLIRAVGYWPRIWRSRDGEAQTRCCAATALGATAWDGWAKEGHCLGHVGRWTRGLLVSGSLHLLLCLSRAMPWLPLDGAAAVARWCRDVRVTGSCWESVCSEYVTSQAMATELSVFVGRWRNEGFLAARLHVDEGRSLVPAAWFAAVSRRMLTTFGRSDGCWRALGRDEQQVTLLAAKQGRCSPGIDVCMQLGHTCRRQTRPRLRG